MADPFSHMDIPEEVMDEVNATLPTTNVSPPLSSFLQLPCKKCKRYTEQGLLTDGLCSHCWVPSPKVPEVKWDDVCPVMKALVEGLAELSGNCFIGGGGNTIIGLRPEVPGVRYVSFRVQTPADMRRNVRVDMTIAEYESFQRWCAGRSIPFQEYT